MRRLLTLAAIPLLAFSLAACGPADEGKKVATAGGPAKANAAPVTKGTVREKLRKFARCMRDNGVDMPDPSSDSGFPAVPAGDESAGTGVARAAGPGARQQRAFEKCRPLMPQGDELPKPKPADLKKAREYAKCMREHGLTDFPDPNADGAILLGRGDAGAVDPARPAFQTAAKACGKYLGGPAAGVGVGLTR
jgi:hypothetical protein